MVERRRRERGQRATLFGGPLGLLVWIGLVLVAVVFAVAYRAGVWFDVPRQVAEDTLGPARSVTSAPFAAMRSFSRGLTDHLNTVEENRRLREENARLQQWYDLAQAMRDKMTRYERLLAANPDPEAFTVTARVVGEVDGPFVRARILNAGTREGVAVDQAVLSERGLIGRVVSVGRSSSRVLLLSDLNSQVPVMAERSDERAILRGDNSARPRLEFRGTGRSLASGDRIVTSGDGGVLPRGLPVGEAVVTSDGSWRVQLFANDDAVDYVRVVRFAFPPAPEDDPPLEALEPDPSPEPTPTPADVSQTALAPAVAASAEDTAGADDADGAAVIRPQGPVTPTLGPTAPSGDLGGQASEALSEASQTAGQESEG